MKIAITPEKITFIYLLYQIETSGRNIGYFLIPKKTKRIKFDSNIDVFGIHGLSLNLKFSDRKIKSVLGPVFGYIMFFLNRMFLYMKNEDNSGGQLDFIAMSSTDYDIKIFGSHKIEAFLQDLKANNYPISDLIVEFDSLSK